jgi:hypothetical protein
MKKLAILIAGIITLQACNPSNNNSGETGTVNDGIKAIDENGALSDSTNNYNPSVDTTIGDNRVDTEQRDTSKYRVKQ